jgi:predicted DNA-binding transcriptional regulator YafY
MLEGARGATVYELAEHLDVATRTALRYLQALQDGGAHLVEERVDRKKRWRIDPGTKRQPLLLSKQQMMSLFLMRRVFDFLDGTGLKDGIDDFFASVEAILGKEKIAGKHLEKKLIMASEASVPYRERTDVVDDAVTALLYDEKLLATHTRSAGGEEKFRIHPYSLVLYKRALYLVAFSEHHQAIRTFSLDGFESLGRLRGEKFKYPEDYDPSKAIDGSFGLVAGPSVRVRIFFTKKVARLVERKTWHPTQKIRRVRDGIEMAMDVRGTLELPSWILSWGDQAEVLEPARIRDEVAAELRRAAELYRERRD